MYWDEIKEMATVMVICLIGVAIFLSLIFGTIATIHYKSSCVAAKIYNPKHNTNYTCSDFFWAGEQINQSTSTINLNQK
jgi:hypothetical protein